MKRVKKVLKFILFAIIFGIVYSFFFTTYENIKVNNTINKFKERGIFEERIEINTLTFSYYREYYYVPRETSAELNDKNNVFKDNDKEQLGIDGDIFVTRQSPFPNNFLADIFVSYYYGGHAAILNYDSLGNPNFLEATGMLDGSESIFDYIGYNGKDDHDLSLTAQNNSTNYWQTPSDSSSHEYLDNKFYRTKYLGLRPVNHFSGTNSDNLYTDYIEAAIQSAKDVVDDEKVYNFLFFLNMRYKYYCTDLVSRAYEEAYERVYNEDAEYQSKGYARKMNDDKFITSVNDIILSRDTFITFYVEIKEEIENNQKVIIERIYYLEDLP